MKGQSGLMEYVVLTFLIMVIVIFLVFFLTGFQVTQFAAEKNQKSIDRALMLIKQLSTSQLLVQDDGVLDDAKLYAMQVDSDSCKDLEGMFGSDWYLEVTVIEDSVRPCSINSYENCNYWELCKESDRNSIAFDIPVNVYRNTGQVLSSDILPTMDLALLKVGVYVE